MAEPTDDPELLRRFAEDKSEAAFAELVRRHLGFVYPLALRRTGEPALAEAATLQVFTAVAREAAALENDPLLTTWLYERTRVAAEQALKAEKRHAKRDTAGAAAANPAEATGLDWPQAAPALDEAIAHLPPLDREALLQRVFRRRSWEEVGLRLSLTGSAVQMRVERGIGRLLAALTERGINVTAPALEQWLSRGAGQPVPPAFFAQVTNGALETASTPERPPALPWNRGVQALVFGAVGVALVAVAIAVHELGESRRLREELAVASQATEAAVAEARALRDRLQAEAKRTQAADEDNARLLEAVTTIASSMPTPDAASPEAVTADTVRARFRHAGELVRARRYADALQEYLWCYDEGMRAAGLRGVRRGLVIRAIADLGRQYPAALQALRERRDAAEAAMQASADDHDAASDLAELNDALGDSARTLAEFDKLPAGDPRRATLASRLKDDLAAAGRYHEITQARPYWQMNSEFETLVAGMGAGTANTNPAVRQEVHDGIVRSTAADIEALAGDGDGEHARALARRLLAFDDSDATRELLQERLARAGQPELLAALTRR